MSEADLEDVARAFCRDCLGWKLPITAECNVYAPVADSLYSEGEDHLHYTDLGSVVDAVTKWSKQTHRWVHLNIAVGRYSATIGTTGKAVANTSSYMDPCYALLRSCVEAQREMDRTKG